ncbi:MAG: response regulator transcription factor [Microbacterium sp.]
MGSAAPPREVGVLVVEDQPLFRQMLTVLLDAEPGIRVVAAFGSSGAAERFDARLADVALLDLRLGDGDGIALGRQLRRRNPGLGVLVLSASDAMHVLLDIPGNEATGWGYLSKTSSLSAQALMYAIHAVAAGRTILDPAIRAQREVRRQSPLARLSARQREVVALVADGLTNVAIAERLGLSPRSVDAHLNAAYAGLGIQSAPDRNPRVDAVRAYLAHTAPSRG